MSLDLPTYRGFPLLDWIPDMSDPSGNMDFQSGRTVVDGIAGPQRYDRPSQLASRTARSLRFLLQTRQELLDARAFARDVAAGRLNGFWVPTWTQDLFLAAPVAADDTMIAITRMQFATLYGDLAGGREHVALFPHIANTGPLLTPRHITDVAVDGDTEILTLDSAIGHDVDAGDLLCFLQFCRADSDALAVIWEHMTVGTFTLPLIDLPTETP